MKILHMNSYYVDSEFFRSLYDLQISNNIDISVYIPVEKDFVETFDFGRYSLVSRVFNKFDRIFFHVKHRKIISDVMAKYEIPRFELIHAHSLFSNGYIALKLKKKYSIPYIVAVRNTDVNVFFKLMIHLRGTGVEILNNAERIIFLSPKYRERVIEEYAPNVLKESMFRKSLVIPNGIDKFWFKNAGKCKNIDRKSPIRLIFVGSLDSNKNVVSIIKASEILINEGLEIKLSIIGKVVEEKIIKLIKSKEFIDYFDYMPKEKLIFHYLENQIFIMPSKFETFGLVYAEAMSQGLPVIYTRGQGFDGHFEDETVGYAVDCNNVVEISESVKNIIKNYEIFSSCAISKSNLFKWEKVEREYANLYDEILNSKK